LQCVAVCCLSKSGWWWWVIGTSSVLQYVAVCCSVLQCVAVCCSVLQCVVFQSQGGGGGSLVRQMSALPTLYTEH